MGELSLMVDNERWLLDTHALIFWDASIEMSLDLVAQIEQKQQMNLLYVAAISFWEIALLIQKGRLAPIDVKSWKTELFATTRLQLLTATPEQMIDSAQLPPYHKDPFDRLLVVQANAHHCKLVTKDKLIEKYPVETIWF